VERNLASHASARRRGGLPRLYVAIWVALSSMALTYLAMFSIRPDLADGLGRHIAALAGSESSPMRASEIDGVRTLAELADLRRTVDTLQTELSTVRAAVAGREDRDQAFAARLSAIEAQRVAEQSNPLSTASINPPSDARTRSDDEPATARGARGRTVEVPPVELAPPTLTLNSLPERAPPRQEKPSERERVAFGPPQVKPSAAEPSGPRGVQIAMGPSVDALRISWMLLSERHKEILRVYEPRFVPTTGASPGYRLIAGPIENTAAANRVCAELRARRVTCGVSAFGGEPL
jgi:SPOR domain